MIGSMVMMVWLGSLPAAAFTGVGTDDTGPAPVETADSALPVTDSGAATTPVATTGDTGTVVITDPTDPTDPTGTGTVTTTSVTTDTDIDCPDCVGASELAGDEGGSPCGDCTTGGASPWLGLVALVGLVRRRRR